MNKKTITALAATIMMGMTLPAFGGEGKVRAGDSAQYRYKGYGVSEKEAYYPDSIYLTLNRAIRTHKDEWIRKSIRSPEYRRLNTNVNFATRLWENVPTARVRFGMTYITYVADLDNKSKPISRNQRNMVTLQGTDYSRGRTSSWTSGTLSSDGFREILEFDVIIERCLANRYKERCSYNSKKKQDELYRKERNDPGFLTREARSTITHEIGHGMGLNHSWLNPDLLVKLTQKKSLQSVMSYNRCQASKGFRVSGMANGRLNPDDVAIISRLYPNFINRISRTTGTVRGVVLNAFGTEDIYGANVVLVRRNPGSQNGSGILSRISGYATSRPGAETPVRNGDFVLNGVPPGKYDLLVTAWNDSCIRTGNPKISLSGAKKGNGIYMFDRGFKRAWVRGIYVRAGQDTNVGYVQAGKNRPFKNPGLMDMAISFRAPRDGNYRIRLERRSSYWAFLRWCTKKIKHRYHKVYESDSISFSKGTQAHTFRAKPGKYYASVFRVSGRTSKRVLFRKYVDLRASLVEANWNRKSRTVTTTRGGVTRKLPVEAWRYVITTTSRFQSHDQERTYALHGKRVLFFQAGSIRSPRVEADWGGDPVTIGLKKRCQTNTSGFAKIKVCLTYR